jgi:hypothetical protein
MLLNWYNYSITGVWNCLGRLCEKYFHLLIKLNWLPDIFYISLGFFLFFLWMGIMRKYEKQREDKGIIK